MHDESVSVMRDGGHLNTLFGRSSLSLAASTSVIEGLPDEQKSSPVRRTFLLLMLFDLIVSFILWIIYVQQLVKDGGILAELRAEVVYYSFKTSFFDSFMLALGRFMVIEFVYGIFRVKTPWWSAATTAATSAVLIAKSLVFDFIKIDSRAIGLAYGMIIASLILTWIETTFLICRVIPQERAASHVASYLALNDDDTRSLVGLRIGPNFCEPSIAPTFYTADNCSFRGDDDFAAVNNGALRTAPDEFVSMSDVHDKVDFLRTELWHLYNSDAWGLHATVADQLSVRHTNFPNYNCVVFRLEITINVCPQVVFQELVYNNFGNNFNNQSLDVLELIHSISSENIDIVRMTTREALNGLISKRDFILIRTWGEHEKHRYLVGSSFDHPKFPPRHDFVRAEQLISGFIVSPDSIKPSSCRVVWIICNDIKMSLPQRILNSAVQKGVSDYMKNLKSRLELRSSYVSSSNAPFHLLSEVA